MAEIASAETADLIVNIQGDEPLIDPVVIDPAALALLDDPELPMGTLKKRIEDPGEILNPNVVKVVTDQQGDALYFSRCAIPMFATRPPLQAHRVVCLPARFPAGLFRSAAGPARTNRAAGTIARARKRLPGSRDRN